MHRTTTSEPSPAKNVPLLISRNYALLWSGQAVSRLGDTVFLTTVVLWVATRLATGYSWAPLAVGAVFLVSELPEIVVGPIAGVYVDRWDKRRAMLTADLVRACLIGLLILAAGNLTVDPMHHAALQIPLMLGVTYTSIGLITAASWFFIPARVALIGDIVEDRHRERASGLAQTSEAVVTIAGPAVAAPLFFTVGVGWALAVDGLSFLVSFVAVWLVHAPQPARSVEEGQSGNLRAELSDGLHLVLSNGVLKALLVAGILISVGFASLQALAIFFLRQNLHASASLYGLLSGAQGAGALLGAVLGARLAERLGVGRLVWQAACLLGLLFILFSRLTSFAPAMTVLFLIGATFAVLEVAESPLLLRATPRESLGRVTALLFPAFGAVSALTSLVAGGLASAWRGSYAAPLGLSLGPIDAVITGGGCLVVVAGLYARSKLTPFPVSSPPLDEGSAPHPMQSHPNP